MALGCKPRATPEANTEGALTWTQCETPVAPEAKCGVVRVEEKRGAPNGRTIDLALVLVPALARTPATDPIVLLAGGPGQGAASLAPMILQPLEPLRAERDLLFVDIRGTGKSNALTCEFEDPEDLALMLGGKSDLSILDRCLADFDARGGVDLTQYTTTTIVEDLEEVRAALGYEQVNLLGISYGTSVAQVYMRDHASSVRSVVLDGVVPLDERVSIHMPRNNEAALEAVLGDCNQNEDCAAALPGLERKLAAVLEDLGSNRVLETIHHPRTGQALELDIAPEGFAGTLSGALYSAKTTSLIPHVIERAHVGDYDPLAALALSLGKMSDSLSMGLYFSVACAEDLDTLSPETRAQAIEGLHTFSDHSLEIIEQACARWPHAELEDHHRALESTIPTLVFSGAYDPVTPPMFGQHMADTLANAHHVAVAGASHGVWHLGCAPELMAGFFASPDPAGVDASCLDNVARPGLFINANGPWPLAPAKSALDSTLAQGESLGGPQ